MEISKPSKTPLPRPSSENKENVPSLNQGNKISAKIAAEALNSEPIPVKLTNKLIKKISHAIKELNVLALKTFFSSPATGEFTKSSLNKLSVNERLWILQTLILKNENVFLPQLLKEIDLRDLTQPQKRGLISLAVLEAKHEVLAILIDHFDITNFDEEERDLIISQAIGRNDNHSFQMLVPKVKLEQFRDEYKHTCLLAGAWGGNKEIVRELLQHIDFLSLGEDRQKSIFESAHYKNHREIAEMLTASLKRETP